MDFQYVMVTDWNDHWDKLEKYNNSTLFTIFFIKDPVGIPFFPKEATTLFIKRTKGEQSKFEKSWIGKVDTFKPTSYKGQDAFRFNVSDLKEVNCPPEFKLFPNGWYLNKSNIQIPSIEKWNDNNLHMQPPFFSSMAKCNPEEFEQYTFLLLRLLGIHDFLQYPQGNNGGRADGFFIIGNLSVLYDATLKINFSNRKETQIENYINQLKGDKVTLEKRSFTIKHTERQVWIITRNKSIDIIKEEDQIKVKEIPYTKLIEIYHLRLNADIGTADLEDTLRHLA